MSTQETFEAKQELKNKRKGLEAKYKLLPLQVVVEKLALLAEERRAARVRLIEAVRTCSSFYEQDTPSTRRKINKYPGEIGDARLILLINKYYSRELKK